jgi:hypothetical protein
MNGGAYLVEKIKNYFLWQLGRPANIDTAANPIAR